MQDPLLTPTPSNADQLGFTPNTPFYATRSAEKMALQPDIDGFLVGGSSLKDDFLDIIANAEKGLAARN